MVRYILFITLYFLSVNSFACLCGSPSTPEERFHQASAVYVLTLTEVRAAPELHPEMHGGMLVFVLGTGKVEEILKGAPEFESIESGLFRSPFDQPLPTTSCGSGIPLAPYETYIVFESNGEQPRMSLCGGNAIRYHNPRDEGAPDILEQLRQL